MINEIEFDEQIDYGKMVRQYSDESEYKLIYWATNLFYECSDKYEDVKAARRLAKQLHRKPRNVS